MGTKNSSAKIEKETKKAVEQILKLLGFKLEVDVKAGEHIAVDINGDDLGLLIGSHGDHLETLQTIVGIIVNKKLDDDEWKRVVVDIGDWRKGREEDLRVLLSREADKLGGDNKEIKLPPMPPSQRRVVHVLASEYPDIESISVGEEPDRRVVLKRKEDGKD